MATVAQSLLGLLISACIVIKPWSPRHCTEMQAGGESDGASPALEPAQHHPTRSGNRSALQGTVHPQRSQNRKVAFFGKAPAALIPRVVPAISHWWRKTLIFFEILSFMVDTRTGTQTMAGTWAFRVNSSPRFSLCWVSVCWQSSSENHAMKKIILLVTWLYTLETELPMSPTLWCTRRKHTEVTPKRENLLVHSVYWEEQSSGELGSVTPHSAQTQPLVTHLYTVWDVPVLTLLYFFRGCWCLCLYLGTFREGVIPTENSSA